MYSAEYVNVVIPSYNRISEVCSILDILGKQELEARVILCDDGSENTIVKLHTFYPCLWKYLWTRRDGLYHRVARINEGLRFCDSKYVIIIDNDCIPHSVKFTMAYASLLNEHDVVRGKFLDDDGVIKMPKWFSTANIGFRKAVIDRLPHKGFDPAYDGRYGFEDADMGHEVESKFLIGEGSDDTAVKHVGVPYSGDRASAQENEKIYKRKWNYD